MRRREQKGRRGGSGGRGARACAGFQVAQAAMEVFKESVENAPVKGGGKKADVIEEAWVFEDFGGSFKIYIEEGLFSTKYYKVYINRTVPGSMKITISKLESDFYKRLGEKRWGYMKFNWSNWEWEFVPGTERKELERRYPGRPTSNPIYGIDYI